MNPCIHDPKGLNENRPCGPTCYGTQDVHSTDTLDGAVLRPGGITVIEPATATQIGGTHYRDMAIQPAEFIHKNGIEFLPGCVIKRMCRWRKKDGLKDLRKAIHEIELMIEFEEQP